jgi:Xaa-Pro aminopeptidase
MPPAFLKAEYDDRLARLRGAMQARGLDALVIGDPANINWLTGYDAWSSYTPQMMFVGLQDGPFWVGREMDAGAALDKRRAAGCVIWNRWRIFSICRH